MERKEGMKEGKKKEGKGEERKGKESLSSEKGLWLIGVGLHVNPLLTSRSLISMYGVFAARRHGRSIVSGKLHGLKRATDWLHHLSCWVRD